MIESLPIVIKFRPNYVDVRIVKNKGHYSVSVSRHFIGTQTSEEGQVEEFEAESSFHNIYEKLWDDQIKRIVEESDKLKEFVGGRRVVNLYTNGLSDKKRARIKTRLESRRFIVKFRKRRK